MNEVTRSLLVTSTPAFFPILLYTEATVEEILVIILRGTPLVDISMTRVSKRVGQWRDSVFVYNRLILLSRSILVLSQRVHQSKIFFLTRVVLIHSFFVGTIFLPKINMRSYVRRVHLCSHNLDLLSTK